MNRQPFERPPKWWGPKLSRFWIRVWRPFRLRRERRLQRLTHVDVQGLDHLREPLDKGQGVLITPNHPSHADTFAMYRASDAVGRPFHFMAAWQVFGTQGPLSRLILQHHGVFSVDREGIDRQALNQAVEILRQAPYPLVIFPEGEVYHLNDRVTPFREGPATIAHMALRKAEREIVCVPCGLKFHYVEDPTPELTKMMDRLEREIFWRPRNDLPLDERIYRFAEGPLALKELEILGEPRRGPLPERVRGLCDAILDDLESRHGVSTSDGTLPERVKAVRQRAIRALDDAPENDPRRQALLDDLDDVFLVVQLFSYPGDYVAESPTIERMAETLDKFEEDVLDKPTATVRAARRGTVRFGEPVPVTADKDRRGAAARLTQTLEERVQALLDEIPAPRDREFAEPKATA